MCPNGVKLRAEKVNLLHKLVWTPILARKVALQCAEGATIRPTWRCLGEIAIIAAEAV